MDAVTWTLYVYLGVMGTIQVPGYFDNKPDCLARGEKEVADFRAFHRHAAAFKWCMRNGKMEKAQ